VVNLGFSHIFYKTCVFEQAEGFARSTYEKAVGMKYRWAEIKAGSLLYK
jgi:hypothetical protein